VSTLAESLGSGGTRPIHDALAQSVDVLSSSQTVEFVPYVRQILPVDGYLFWVNASLLTPQQLAQAGLQSPLPVIVSGSLHYGSRGVQVDDETIVVRRVDFAAPAPIAAFAEVAPSVLYVASWTTAMGPFKFTFGARGTFYEQAGLSHYEGDAIYPAFEAQLIDDISTFDQRQVVSNSLPLWLAMARTIPVFQLVQPGLTLYPAFLVPDNLLPAYGVVDIQSTRALQAIAYRDRLNSRWQLVADRVRLTTYGLRNDDVMNLLDYSIDYCTNIGTFGLMSTPIVRDERRTQVELAAVAQKKTIEYEVSYHQHSARVLARQVIQGISVSVYPQDYAVSYPPPTQPPFYISFGLNGTFADQFPSEWDGNYQLAIVELPVPVVFPTNFASSPTLLCQVAPASNVTIYFQMVSGNVGSIFATGIIPAGQTSGYYTLTSAMTVPAGAAVRVMALANVDTSIVGVYGTLVGTRALQVLGM
jgi:hypothetical protein